MVDDLYIGPCGKVCKVCKTRDNCPVSQEQWDLWLSLDQLNPKSKDDAMTPARKLYYMKYVDDDNQLMGWMDKLLVDCWHETHRDDYNYRYPIPADKLRSFLEGILKEHLTNRERQVIKMRLGLDTGKQMPFTKMSELFNISNDKLGIIYKGAIEKLKKAIVEDKRWRRRGPDGRFV